jgi:hypothetical protein
VVWDWRCGNWSPGHLSLGHRQHDLDLVPLLHPLGNGSSPGMQKGSFSGNCPFRFFALDSQNGAVPPGLDSEDRFGVGINCARAAVDCASPIAAMLLCRRIAKCMYRRRQSGCASAPTDAGATAVDADWMPVVGIRPRHSSRRAGGQTPGSGRLVGKPSLGLWKGCPSTVRNRSVSELAIWQQGICRVAPRVLCEVAYMRGTVSISSDSRETQRLRLG